MKIEIYSSLIWLTTLLIGSLGIFIYFGSKRLSSRIFALNIGLIVIWSLAVSLIPLSNYSNQENIILKFTFYIGGVISAAFYYFCKTFPEDTKPSKKLLWIIITTEVLFFPLYFFSDLIIGSSYRIDGPWGWGQRYGPLWFLFDISFFIFWVGGVVTLYKKYYRMSSGIVKTNLGFMIISITIGFIPPTIFSIVLPHMGYYDLDWLGPVSGGLWIPLIAYSITRHHLFNIKVIAVELVTFSLWIFILIRILFAATLREASIEGGLLVITVIFGVILIRSVLREIRQREQIEGLAANLEKAYVNVKDLNEHLEEKVAEQMEEIKRAYEVEKTARRELEKLDITKNELITAAQHNLRTPLTALRWQLENMRKNSDDNNASGLRQAITESEESVERLTRVLEDFLRITEVRVGNK